MGLIGNVAKFFHLISIRERNNQVYVSGVDGTILAGIIQKAWGTNKINKYMFTTITSTGFSFNSFYIPDMDYILTQISTHKDCSWGMRTSINKIIEGFKTNTWYKSSVGDVKSIIDVNRLNLIKWKPMEHQSKFLLAYGDVLPRYGLKGYIVAFLPGQGKAAPLDSKVLTVDGFKRMGDVVLGEKVMTPKGKVATVIGVFPQGLKDIYELTLEGGQKTQCCDEHLWKVRTDDGSTIVDFQTIRYSSSPTFIPVVEIDGYTSKYQRIKHIRYVGKKEAQCIMIDDPEHLYITDDYIVTHNTIMDIFVATCVIPPSVAEVKIIISPKKAVHLVWEKTIRAVFKKKPTYWCSDEPVPMPEKNCEYYIFNYEKLGKAIELAKILKARNVRYFIIVDESHNFADFKSDRTQALVTLQTIRDDGYFIWTSGTPIIKHAAELVSYLKCADPRFDKDAENSFKKIYTNAPGRANEIVNHRLGKMMVATSERVAPTIYRDIVKELPIKIPKQMSDKFLMSSVRQEMKEFIKERLEFYKSQMDHYREIVNTWLTYHEKLLTTKKEKQDFVEYVKAVKLLSRNPDLRMPDEMSFCRQYERRKLLPSIPAPKRREFKNALSTIKTIKLKVRGEALGKILAARRSECAAALAYYCKPEEIMKNSLSKTLFFSSSVLPIKVLDLHLRKKGFNPVLVYGPNNANLTKMMDTFEKDPMVNPVCATFKSLSEAVPVTAASTVVMLDRPYRQSNWEQAASRSSRFGQKYQVTIIETVLDTGSEPNVSTRTDDILADVREMISDILGKDYAGPDPTEREYATAIDASSQDPEVGELDDYMNV